jgi:hypothetical protein
LGHALSLAEAAMTTKRKLLVLLGVIMVTAVVIAYTVRSARSAINAENAAKIEIGIDLATVEALLGGPARDESTGRLTTTDKTQDDAEGVFVVKTWRLYMSAGMSQRAQNWSSDEIIVFVEINDVGRVERVETFCVSRVAEWPWDLFRRWLWR